MGKDERTRQPGLVVVAVHDGIHGDVPVVRGGSGDVHRHLVADDLAVEPAEVDPYTGYRYYATTQVPTAQVIRRFRDLGMPVREVGEVLSTTDPATAPPGAPRSAGQSSTPPLPDLQVADDGS